MAICEMCGKTSQLYRISIEGSQINVCKDCGKFGKILKKVDEPKIDKKQFEEQTVEIKVDEPDYIINQDYAKLIREKRESSNLTQEEFAKKLNEKESLIHNLETGKHEPSLKLAEKIEKILKMKLIEKYKEEDNIISKNKPDSFTIGDFIKVKK